MTSLQAVPQGGHAAALCGHWSKLAVAGLTVLAAVSSGAIVHLAGASDDFRLFSLAGQKLLSADWANAFSDQALQIGPLYLVVTAFVSSASLLLGGDSAVSASIFGGLTAIAAACSFTGGARRQVGFLACLLLGGPMSVLALEGHFEELLCVLFLLAASRSAAEQRSGRAVAFVALASGMKAWGVLGLPLLLVLPRPARKFALPAALAAIILPYAPFMWLGDVNTFEHRWPIATPSPLALLTIGHFSWWGRVAQAALTCVVGVALARRSQGGSPELMVLGVLGSRLLLDPDILSYYWVAPGVAMFAYVWAQQWTSQKTAAITALVTVAIALSPVLGGRGGSLVAVGTLLAMLAVAAKGRPEARAFATSMTVSAPV